ncbi:MAG: alpha/beta fold hydrolase [Pirellulales bacterium]|nr:alpha/beta fold hydrolase [Pirellulales bacterium]
MQLEVISHHPQDKPRPTPLLFVHGTWHGAWCWEKFQPFFAEHGYESHAVSLRGHGNSKGRHNLRWHSAARDYVADVTQIVEKMRAPPVLIGHSMGGYIIQRYLENHTAPAGILLASIPVTGIYQFALRVLLRTPWAFIKSHLTLDPWYVVSTPELAQVSFFSPDMSAEEVNRHFQRLGHASFLIEIELLFLALPHPKKVTTPLLILAAENDRVFSVAEEQATARAYNTRAEVFPDMAHDMMLEPGWQKVAERILGWLRERDL